jgi:hypothetical protein
MTNLVGVNFHVCVDGRPAARCAAFLQPERVSGEGGIFLFLAAVTL